MNIMYIIAGIVAFCLFLVYDIKLVKGKSKGGSPMFFAGCLLLALSTGALLVSGWNTCNVSLVRVIPFLAAGLVFLLLLVYTLFFAIPFGDTYVNDSGRPKVCMTGIYGICRHPGFLWFFGLYACIALAVPQPAVICGSVIFTLCNLGYIIFQDVWSFPAQFDEYDVYKKKVPFLIPNRNSIREGIRTL